MKIPQDISTHEILSEMLMEYKHSMEDADFISAQSSLLSLANSAIHVAEALKGAPSIVKRPTKSTGETVYVVTKGWYDNTEVIACFRDKHKAKEYCDKKNKISNESKGSRYYYEFVSIQILD